MQRDPPEVGVRVRVPSRLRAQFVEACRSIDSTASQELRAFMRRFVENRQEKRVMPQQPPVPSRQGETARD